MATATRFLLVAAIISRVNRQHSYSYGNRAEKRKKNTVQSILKGQRITGNARAKLTADLAQRYEKGASIRSLAESLGRSYGFVHRVLGESDAVLRGRGGSKRTS